MYVATHYLLWCLCVVSQSTVTPSKFVYKVHANNAFNSDVV